jgi:hypothetical protein
MMRAPKKITASPNFMTRGHPLKPEVRDKLVEYLGFGKVDFLAESLAHQMPGMKALPTGEGAPLQLVPNKRSKVTRPKTDVGLVVLKIEVILGIYVDGASHLDNIPRPSDYVAAFTSVRDDAVKLIQAITNWTEYFRDQFSLKGANVHEIERALGQLFDVSNTVISEMSALPSKGAKKNNALAEVVRGLRNIFHANYQGKRTKRPIQGGFTFLAPQEKAELAFVGEAIRSSRIVPQDYADTDLSRLFRDPRCAIEGKNPAPKARRAMRPKVELSKAKKTPKTEH